MLLNRQTLKKQAKMRIRTSEPKITNVGLIYVLLSAFVSILSARVMGAYLSEGDIAQITEHLMRGNYEFALSYIQDYIPSTGSYFIALALDIVLTIVSAGFIIFLLNSIRAKEACKENLLDGFGMAGRIILLSLLEGLYVFLWSLLLIVPGIIASYRYRQAIYLLIDHPEMSVSECIKESKRMMSGRKAELFMLDLSFIGWKLLSGFTVIGWAVQVWSVPYMGMCYAMYYELLCGRLDNPENFNTDV